MSLLEWRDEFQTGVPDIDFEHQELFSLINSFYTALENNTDKDKLINVLNDIYGGIYSHFMHEENLMEKYGYDQYQQHHEDHVDLLDDIRDFTDELEKTDIFDEEQLKEKLNTWFTVHFKTHDARLHLLEDLIASGELDEGTMKKIFSKYRNLLSL